jgi:transporter family protein
MLWLAYALIAAITGGFIGILNRFVLKDHDFISYGFLWNIVTAILFIPLFLSDFVVPTGLYAWAVTLLGVSFWTLAGFAGFKAVQMVEVSLSEPLSQTQMLFLLVFSSLFLSELLTMNKIIGTFLIFFGIITLTYEKRKFFGKITDRGIQLTLLTSLLVAMASIVDKTALRYWSVPGYSFVAFLFPGLIMGVTSFKRFGKLVKMVKLRWFPLILSTILAVVNAYFLFSAYRLTEVSNVFPITRISILVVVLGGIILLKERKDILKKILGAIIMILGTLLVSGYV